METEPTNLVLAGDIFNKMLRMQRHLRQYNHQMKSKGISPRNYAVLRFLLESGPTTVGQIQTHMVKSASTISCILTHLEEMGHICRTRSSVDNRVVMVELTPSGREIAESAPLGGLPLLCYRLRELPDEQLVCIDEGLSKLLDLLDVPETD